MAGTCACRSHCQNFQPVGEDDCAGTTPETPTNDSSTPSHTPALSRVIISAPSPFSALANSTNRYSEKDFQRIFKTVLEARAPNPAPQLLVFLNRPRRRPLKTSFSNLYCGKTHIECYNFCQQCENHFATAGATGLPIMQRPLYYRRGQGT